MLIKTLAKESIGKNKTLEYKHVADYVQSDNNLEFLHSILPKKITGKTFLKLLNEPDDSDKSDNSDESDSSSSSSSDDDESSSSESGSSAKANEENKKETKDKTEKAEKPESAEKKKWIEECVLVCGALPFHLQFFFNVYTLRKCYFIEVNLEKTKKKLLHVMLHGSG